MVPPDNCLDLNTGKFDCLLADRVAVDDVQTRWIGVVHPMAGRMAVRDRLERPGFVRREFVADDPAMGGLMHEVM
jgi:hypothetical protein